MLPVLNQLAENPQPQLGVSDVFLRWSAVAEAVLTACAAPALPDLDPALATKVSALEMVGADWSVQVPATIDKVAELGYLRETEKKLKHWTQEAIMILLIQDWLASQPAVHPASLCIVEVSAPVQ